MTEAMTKTIKYYESLPAPSPAVLRLVAKTDAMLDADDHAGDDKDGKKKTEKKEKPMDVMKSIWSKPIPVNPELKQTV